MIALYSNSNLSGANNHSIHHERKRPRMYHPISLPIRRPLLDLHTAAAIADTSHEKLAWACEAGAIQYSFDLRRKSAGHRCLRVLAHSLHAYINDVPADACRDTPASLRAVVAEIFPALSDTITGVNFARIICCDSAHVIHLVRDQELLCAKQPGRAGPGSSPDIYRASAVHWLCSRRLLP
jgi:hypothetical protein